MISSQEPLKTQALLTLAQQAGREILRIYNDPAPSADIDYKADNSPLTLADKASHEVIDKGLRSLYPDIPIISEEGEQLDYEVRKHFNTFWLVDPLDGTKEFINRNGEFTVNIALIKDDFPVAGFIYAPVLNTFFYTDDGSAYKIEQGAKTRLNVLGQNNGIAVRSKSHASEEEESILQEYMIKDSVSVGSSLKFCLIADKKASLYYRFGPTMEWDTAAGQAVLEVAGGSVSIETGDQRFVYNKQSLLNTGFLCKGF
ncbi:MAG: 3'(2'),5'-bisphosphate nucleotidase CysQ [Bacteroidota bacterium]